MARSDSARARSASRDAWLRLPEAAGMEEVVEGEGL
jgi:hypothetical protein